MRGEGGRGAFWNSLVGRQFFLPSSRGGDQHRGAAILCIRILKIYSSAAGAFFVNILGRVNFFNILECGLQHF